MNPILTVVIPVYNGEKYVRRAVESVVNQPESVAVKVLLVNDGSTDASGSICDALAREYENVLVIHKENGGVSSARNLGIENVTTKYIAFLDCDDWWETGFLDANLIGEFQNANAADVYEFSYTSVNQNVSLAKLDTVKNDAFTFDVPELGRYDWRHPCSFVYAIELLRTHSIQYPFAKVGEDGPFVEMALFHSKSLKRIDKLMFFYWENMRSCMHTTDILTDTRERFKAFLQEADYLMKYDIDLDAECSYLWTIASNLPRICAENSYKQVVLFMNEECFPRLNARADICFRKELMDRFEQMRTTPLLFWLKYRIRLGLPIMVKNIFMRIPMIDIFVNYIYNRYYRHFQPLIRNQQKNNE